jgi:deoxyribonuclease-4
MQVRKKYLKIQERLGMRIGLTYGISTRRIVSTPAETMEVLGELYKVGFRAFVLPPKLFANVINSSDLYKEHYDDLLNIKNMAKKYNIELSIRVEKLPSDPAQLDSVLKILCSIASVMDCRTVMIQPNFYPRMPQHQALTLVVHKISELTGATRMKPTLGIETTGRTNELGSLEDVLEICSRTSGTEPIINLAHIHARGAGALRSENDYRMIIDKIRSARGTRWTDNAFLLFSGISYGASGEIQHIDLDRSDIKLNHLIKNAMSFGMKGTLIFEDPHKDDELVDMLNEFADMVR